MVKYLEVNSGLMVIQYAAVALASENKILSHPASVDSITSCENQEDFVSMGTTAARTARDIVSNSRRIIATELLAACQALDFVLDKGSLGEGTKTAHEEFRKSVKFIENDKDIEMYDELEKATDLLVKGDFLKAVEKKVRLDIQFN